MSRSLVPLILFVVMVSSILLLIFGDESYANYSALQRTLIRERTQANLLAREVKSLESEVGGINRDNRTLEKRVRENLPVARANELVFIFEEPESLKSKAGEK